jgi:hypothetical protein
MVTKRPGMEAADRSGSERQFLFFNLEGVLNEAFYAKGFYPD